MSEVPSPLSPRGVVYAAIGQAFVAEAAVSAASLRKHCPSLPITLFTDCPEAASPVFDQVVRLAEKQPRPHLDKLVAMRDSPFAETLFLDTDTFICGAIDPIFAVLARFDMAMTLERRYVDVLPEGTGVADIFGEYNQGVVAYRRSDELDATLRSALDIGRSMAAAGKQTSDQIAMRIALYRSNLRIATLPLEYNCRFHGCGALNGPVVILHSRFPDRPNDPQHLEALARRINSVPIMRIFIAGRMIPLIERKLRQRDHFVAGRSVRLFSPRAAMARAAVAGATTGARRRLARWFGRR